MTELFEVRVEAAFRAHHRRDALGEDAPAHEHSWRVAVQARSRTLDPIAIVVDFRALRDETERILAEIDGTRLEDHPELAAAPTTALEVARWLLGRLAPVADGKPWEVCAVEIECDPGVRYVVSVTEPSG